MNLGLYQKDNVVWDLLPHLAAIMLFYTSKSPQSVRVVARKSAFDDIEDTANIYLKYESGLVASIQVSWLYPYKVREFTFVGSKQMLIIDDMKTDDKLRLFEKKVEAEDIINSFLASPQIQTLLKEHLRQRIEHKQEN